MGIMLLICFLFMIFMNVPIATSLGLSSLIGISIGGFPLEMFPMTVFSAIGKFALLAIPFFILAGELMEKAGISEGLIEFAQVFVGHKKSGLISVVVIVSCFFAAISGSGPATVAALGAILIPAMSKAGYDSGMSATLMASSGAIGIVIPPSIAFVVYASIADVSIGEIFLAGWIPGMLLGIAYVLAAKWSSKNNTNIVLLNKSTRNEKWVAFKKAFWGLLTPVIIMFGIYSGMFTPTEAAGVTVVYALFVGMFIYKTIKLKDLPSIFLSSARSTATVMFIIACASVLAWILSISHIAKDISDGLINLAGNKWMAILLMDIIFLLAGCFLEANSAFYILIPIMLPVMAQFNLNPVHVGVFLTINMAIGQITPPVGVNLYVASNISGVPVSKIIRSVFPFLLCGILALLLISYVPGISLFLPKLMGM